MNEQIEMVYDWMIKNGKRMTTRRATINDKIVYNASRIAQIHKELSRKKGSITRFCEHTVREELFVNLSSAKQALRLYATNIGTVVTDPKRQKLIELYDAWADGKVTTKNMAKYNQKLDEYWRTKWQH